MKLDLTIFGLNCLLICFYYLFLNWKARRWPDSSVHSLHAKIRELWIEKITRSGDSELLAVQTLRNSVMAANFMASTSILLIIGTLNLSDKIGDWALHWHPYNISSNYSSELWQLKLCLLLLDFFIAFFCFSMAIRFFNHVGYMVNPRNDSPFRIDLNKLTSKYLNKAGTYYRIGTRAFFFSLPIILWFFGPLFLTFGTLCLIVGLVMLDRVPS